MERDIFRPVEHERPKTPEVLTTPETDPNATEAQPEEWRPLYLFGGLTEDMLPKGKPDEAVLIPGATIDDMAEDRGDFLVRGEDAAAFFDQVDSHPTKRAWATLLAANIGERYALENEWRSEHDCYLTTVVVDQEDSQWWAHLLDLVKLEYPTDF